MRPTVKRLATRTRQGRGCRVATSAHCCPAQAAMAHIAPGMIDLRQGDQPFWVGGAIVLELQLVPTRHLDRHCMGPFDQDTWEENSMKASHRRLTRRAL